MTARTTMAAVLPTSQALGALRPLDLRGVRVIDGFWADRLRQNRQRTLPHGADQLEASGAIGNLRRTAAAHGVPVAGYRGGRDDAGITFPFLDSDVYKWLEGVGWELGRGAEPSLAAKADEVIDLIEHAQQENGYLGSYVQLMGLRPFHDLDWGHELYCIGHLAQAAVAWSRALGDDRLLRVTSRAVARIDAEVGPGGRDGVDGHPEIEMALVELFRLTGEERYLALARHQIEQRGRGHLGPGRFGAAYWQDVLPVRSAPTVSGHAVRQMYLDCGAVDVAVETGDRELLDAVLARWSEMRERRTYLTGALGSRHAGEAFGDAWELPPDRAYAETCAAIGSVMLAWRLLLATGEERFADAIERALYNAVLPGISLDGTAFFYVNPLQVRPGGTGYGGGEVRGREPWYACACCPPNLMRTFSSLEGMVATAEDAAIRIHQPAGATIAADLAAGPVRLRMETGYPRDGRLVVVVEDTPGTPWTLSVRMPDWCRTVTATVDGEAVAAGPQDGRLTLDRVWRPGSRITVELAMPARLTLPDPRIDAVRGCGAVERGPLVYCLEAMDLPADVALEGVLLEARVLDVDQDDTEGGLPAVRAAGRDVRRGRHAWPYDDAAAEGPEAAATRVPLRFVPYLAWANREPGAMRVWVPLD
jgi:uncharacterized protein